MNQTINEIKSFLQGIPIADVINELERFRNDERKSVQKIVEQYRKKYYKFYIISKESIRFSVIKKSRYIHCSEFDSFLLYQIAINFLIISL